MMTHVYRLWKRELPRIFHKLFADPALTVPEEIIKNLLFCYKTYQLEWMSLKRTKNWNVEVLKQVLNFD